MNTALISKLKESEQDFEFYPTTNEIITKMIHDIKGNEDSYGERRFNMTSILDVGAGHGKVLKAMREAFSNCSLYAIEKSLVLCEELAGTAFIVGTEFKEQSLISKTMVVTFCNPPYSEFETWATKIIRESASRFVYLVIPVRWTNSILIHDALKHRNAKHKVLGEFSFEDAEDRAARARVNLVRIELSHESDDAFDRYFDEQFAHLKARFEHDNKPNQGDEKKERFAGLVRCDNYMEALVDLYNKEMDHIRENYEHIAKLDADLLREFNVTPSVIMACLKKRLSGLKQEYWNELFSRMKSVTNRLISTKRRALLDTLNANGHVDFTMQNIHAVLLWVLKNANQSIDEQLVDVFMTMISKANIRNYKSNQKVFEYNQWRYEQAKPTHIALEYRLVMEHAGGIKNSDWSFEKGLEERAAEFLRDILTVAFNLGFICDTTDSRLYRRDQWRSGSKEEFRCTINGKEAILFDVKAFKNGNMHMRMNQQFMLALNVEMGRLKGWINSPSDAAEELQDMEAVAWYGKTVKLGSSMLPMLTSGKAA